MLRIRADQIDAMRPAMRATIPEHVLERLRLDGLDPVWDAASGDIVLKDARGFSSRIGFARDGVVDRLTAPSGAMYRLESDADARLSAIVYPSRERLEIDRDDRGNVRALRRPGLLEYAMRYDAQDRLLSMRDPDGHVTRYEYHSAGRLASIIDRGGAITSFGWSDKSVLRSVTDPLGRTIRFVADDDGALAAVEFPDGSHQEMGFDPDAGIALIKARDGREIIQELDGDALRAITWGDGTRTEFTFEGENLIRATNSAGFIGHTFLSRGQPRTEETPAGTVQYEYDPDGRLIRLVNPFGDAIEYQYDEDGRVVSLVDWDGREGRIVYSAGGTIAEIHHGNGVMERHTYARAGKLGHAVVTDSNGAWLAEQAYQYDSCERLVAAEEVDRAGRKSGRRFVYDAECRIVGEDSTETGARIRSYRHDAKGNLIDVSGVAIEIGPMDEPRSFHGTVIEYDVLGNAIHLPSARGILRCAYGGDGTLREVEVGGARWRYEYDAFGRRISKTDGSTTIRYGWAGQQLLWEEHEVSPGGTRTRRDYLFLPDGAIPFAFREGNRTYWLQADARGAIVRAFDAAGRVVWRATYDSFGAARVDIAEVRQPFRLVGHYEDEETGLFYNFARYYSPLISSYLSLDPKFLEPGATNYSYARNDPWNRVDPFGTIAPLVLGIGAVAVGGLVGGIVSWATGGSFWGGAANGALTTAGVIVGGLIGGPVGMVVGGMAGGVLGAGAESVITDLVNGKPVCWKCAAEAMGVALLWEVALLGLGKIPGVKQLVKAVGKQLARYGKKLLGKVRQIYYRLRPGKLAKDRGKRKLSEKASKFAKAQRSISPAMREKILYGQRVKNPNAKNGFSNEIIGGHSPKIKTHPNYAVEVVSQNADGTTTVKMVKGFPDGNASKIKNSTLAPDSWSDQKIMDVTKRVGDSSSVGTRVKDGATIHSQVVDGVEWHVIKDTNGKVTSSYPTGGNSKLPPGF